MRQLATIGVLLALAGITLSSQVRSLPAPGQRSTLMSIVSGQVVDDTGRLIENATVRLVSARATATRLTDRRGWFLYENVPAGAYVLTVTKAGYYDGAYGKRRPAGSPLPFEIAATQSMADMRIELFRGCVITGSVVDEGSEPVAGVRVIAFRRDFVEGEWRYTTSGSGRHRRPRRVSVCSASSRVNTLSRRHDTGEHVRRRSPDRDPGGCRRTRHAYPSLFYRLPDIFRSRCRCCSRPAR
jgi:hypothetical protein